MCSQVHDVRCAALFVLTVHCSSIIIALLDVLLHIRTDAETGHHGLGTDPTTTHDGPSKKTAARRQTVHPLSSCPHSASGGSSPDRRKSHLSPGGSHGIGSEDKDDGSPVGKELVEIELAERRKSFDYSELSMPHE